jgi:integrase
MLAACENHRTTMIPTGKPGIYYRGGSYVAVTLHRGKQHKSFHRTLAEASEAKSDRTGTDRPAPTSKRPFDEYARAWVTTCQGRTRRGLDDDTRAGYSRALEQYAIPHFGRTPLRDIGREDIDRLIGAMQTDGLRPASIAKYLAPVRALFADAVEREHLTVNPALRLRINAKAGRTSAQKPDREKVLSRAEVAALLAAVPVRHRLLFEVMAGTGCRISEVLGLEWRDLENRGDRFTLRIERQFYRGTLKANTKTEAGARTIELPPALGGELWKVGADGTGAMFRTRTGGRLSDRNLRRVLDAAAAAVALDGVTHHLLRHTHGSMLLDEGWTIPEVSQRLGHASPKITAEVYAHVMPDRPRNLGFLDELGNGLGNDWATEHPETAANERAAVRGESG